MRINHNAAAVNTYSRLSSAQGAQAKSLEKLSSGLRINRAGDDAAGLAISEKMRGQISGLNQASRNAQDGISLIQTAEGGLNETHSILQRMRELAVQSANDTNTDTDRGEIQKEMNQLSEEITRISNNTEFNSKKLINGGITDTKFHVGANKDQNIELKINAMDSFSLNLTSDVTKASVATGAINITGASISGTPGASVVDGDITITSAVNAGSESNVSINGVNFEAATAGTSLNGKTISINQADISGGDVASSLTRSADGNFTFTIGVSTGASLADTNTNFAIEINSAISTFDAAYSSEVSGFASAVLATGVTAGDAPTAVIGTDTLANGTAAGGSAITFTDSASNSETIVVADDAKSVTGTGAFEGLSFETDAIATASGTITIATETGSAAIIAADGTVTAKAEAPAGIDVSSQSAASDAIETIDNAITKVSAERSKLGAVQNRLDHTINNLTTTSENLSAAESRIRDVDMAKEMMEFTKNNILSQAGTAMLAQANQMPQGVLQLLG